MEVVSQGTRDCNGWCLRFRSSSSRSSSSRSSSSISIGSGRGNRSRSSSSRIDKRSAMNGYASTC